MAEMMEMFRGRPKEAHCYHELPGDGVLVVGCFVGSTQAGWTIESRSRLAAVYLAAEDYKRNMRIPWEEQEAKFEITDVVGRSTRVGDAVDRAMAMMSLVFVVNS